MCVRVSPTNTTWCCCCLLEVWLPNPCVSPALSRNNKDNETNSFFILQCDLHCLFSWLFLGHGTSAVCLSICQSVCLSVHRLIFLLNVKNPFEKKNFNPFLCPPFSYSKPTPTNVSKLFVWYTFYADICRRKKKKDSTATRMEISFSVPY